MINLTLALVIYRMKNGWGKDSIIYRGSLLLECNRLMDHNTLSTRIHYMLRALSLLIHDKMSILIAI
jgi:hypothetical protein